MSIVSLRLTGNRRRMEEIRKKRKDEVLLGQDQGQDQGQVELFSLVPLPASVG